VAPDKHPGFFTENRHLLDDLVVEAAFSVFHLISGSSLGLDEMRLRSYQVGLAVARHPVAQEIYKAPYVVETTDPLVEELRDVLITSYQAAFKSGID